MRMAQLSEATESSSARSCGGSPNEAGTRVAGLARSGVCD
jgi:hypothetical protein